MTPRSSPAGFSLADLLTRILPGSIFIIPLLISIIILRPDLVPNSSILLAVVAIVSFLLGELVDQLRKGLFLVPSPLAYYLYIETGDESKLGFLQRTAVKIDRRTPKRFPKNYTERKEEDRLVNQFPLSFRGRIEEKYGVDFADNSPRDIYDCLIIDLAPNFSERTRRQKAIYVFSENLKLSTFIATLFYTAVFLRDPSNIFVLLPTAILVILLTILILFMSVLGTSSTIFVELLFKEFYMTER